MLIKQRLTVLDNSIVHRLLTTEMMSVCLVTLITVGGAQLTGCNKAASYNPALADTFFPLKPGSSWTYRMVDSTESATEIRTDRVVGKEYIKPLQTVASVVSEISYGPMVAAPQTILYVSENGYFTRLSVLDRLGIIPEEREFLPQPLMPHSTWSNSLVPFGFPRFHAEQHHRAFFEAAEVVVPAGHFSGCLRIETEAIYADSLPKNVKDLHLTYIDWYCPTVGLVKTIVLKKGYINWYTADTGLIRTWLLTTGVFSSEVAKEELLSFSRPPEVAEAGR